MTTPALIAMNRNDGAALIQWRAQRSCYAEVSIGSFDEEGQLIKQVIRFAFDTLGVRHPHVRVFGVDQEARRASDQPLTIGMRALERSRYDRGCECMEGGRAMTSYAEPGHRTNRLW
jgi:hypothetical protein